MPWADLGGEGGNLLGVTDPQSKKRGGQIIFWPLANTEKNMQENIRF